MANGVFLLSILREAVNNSNTATSNSNRIERHPYMAEMCWPRQ